jgi:hypothetical protein
VYVALPLSHFYMLSSGKTSPEVKVPNDLDVLIALCKPKRKRIRPEKFRDILPQAVPTGDTVNINSPVYHQLSRLSIVKKPGSLSKKGIKESKATPRPVDLTKEMGLTIVEVRLNTIGDWNVFDRREPSYLIVLT